MLKVSVNIWIKLKEHLFFDMKEKKIFILKRKFFLLVCIIFFIIFFLLVKINITPFLLNPVKDELKNITGQNISIERISISFFPLYVEFKNLVIFKSEDNSLRIEKIKLYPGFTKIFNKEIEIRRTILINGNFNFDLPTLNEIINNIDLYFKKILRVPLKLRFNSLDIENISGTIKIKRDLNIGFFQFNSRIKLKEKTVISMITNIKILSEVYPNVDTNIKASLEVKDNEVIFEELKIFEISSFIKTAGSINYLNFLGELYVTGKLFFKSLMKFFGFTSSNYGELDVEGKIHLIEAKDWLNKIKLNISFKGSFLLEELMKILKVTEKLSGLTEIYQGKLEGTLSDFEVYGKVKLKNGNILGVKSDEIKTNYQYKRGILEFRDGKIKLYGGSAKAYVWITLPKVISHYVSLEINNVSSNRIFELINWNPQIAEGVVNGWLISQGNIFSPRGSFVYERKSDIPRDLRGKINFIKGDFESKNSSYIFKSLEFFLDKTTAYATGYVDLKNNNLNFNFDSKSNDISELLKPYQQGIYGDAYINGKLSGPITDPQISLNFISNNLNVALDEIEEKVKNQTFTFEHLKGNIEYRKNFLNSSIVGENLSIKGKIFFPNAKNLFELSNPIFDISFYFNNVDVKNFYLKQLGDNLHTRMDIKGNIKDKGSVTADVIMAPVYIGNKKAIDKAFLSLLLQKHSLSINKGDFYVNDQVLQVAGHIDFNGQIDIIGKSKNFNVTPFIEKQAIKLNMKYLDKFELNSLNFLLKGSFSNPAFKGDTEVKIRSKNGKICDGNMSFNYEFDRLVIKSNLLRNISFLVEGSLDKDNWKINGEFHSARVDALLGLFINNLSEDFVFMVDGKIEGSISGDKINTQMDLNRVFTRIYGIGLNNKNIVKINVKNNNIYFDPIMLIGQSTELMIKGKVVDYYDILIEGNSDLRPFKAILKLDDLRGRASMLVYIYGDRENPEIAGEIETKNSSITIKKDIPSFNNLNAIISFNEDRVLIEKASATFSQGTVQLEGSAYLEKFKIKNVALLGKFSDVRWIFTPKCWAYLDGQIYLSGDYDHPVLSGQVNVSRGVYIERFDWTKLALQSRSATPVASKDSWLSNLKFNLRIQGDNFFVNNNLATMNINSDLILKGTLDEPAFLGWINAKDGWVYFRGNKFDISRLLIQFTEAAPTNPYINLTARTNINQYNVNLNINGYIDQFNLLLSSNPPLSEQELLNLLVLGQSATSTGGIPGASEAASFITGQMEEVIQERIRGITGLDIMTVEPAISKSTGTINPRITVGKKLMDGKMTVTYSTATGTTVEHIIKVEYFIKKGIYLVGTRDEIGGISGAIKFRFEFR